MPMTDAISTAETCASPSLLNSASAVARIFSLVLERDTNQLDFFLSVVFFAVVFAFVVLGFALDRALVGVLSTVFGLCVRCVVIFFFEAGFGFLV